MSAAEMMAHPVLQVGGTLRRDALYVERAADRELPERLGRGEYCYLLAARQIGKSSLCVRTARALRQGGARTAFVDLTQFGSGAADPGQWYYSIAHRIAEELGLLEPAAYWQAHGLIPPMHRFAEYLRHEVLAQIHERVVVFIDEVDAARGLPAQARDEFFTGLRALYNARAQDPTFERLTFCLIGWGLPSDLVQDTARTPFNIGYAIQLEDFSREEMNAFAPAFARMPGQSQALLDEVYAWTEGHPYMTQKLVEALIDEETGTGGDGAAFVAEAVRRLFLERGRVEDANLSFAARCFDRRDDRVPAARVPALLQSYRQLLEGQPVAAQGNDEVQASLRLTGVAAERRDAGGAWLRVRNRIFARVFDAAWVKARESERRLTEPLRRWLQSGKREVMLRGAELREAETWAQGRQDLTAEEQEFLRAGLDAERQAAEMRQRQLEAEMRQRQAEAEVRRRRRTNMMLTLVAVVLGSSFVASFEQYRQARHAEQRALAAQERAETGLLNEQAERAMALAEQPAHRLRALALAMQSMQSSFGQRRSPSLTVKNGLLVTAMQPIPTTFAGHTGAVWRAVFSPDGARVLTASADGTARMWDASTGRSLLTLKGHIGSVIAAAFSPDGARILTASRDGTARVWDAGAGRSLHTLQGHTKEVVAAAFSPDGARILTASRDGTARVWDAGTGRSLLTLEGHTDSVLAAAFSPDGSRILTASWDGTARVWNAATGRSLFTLQGHTKGVLAAAFSPDGSRILTASWDGTARVWNAAMGRSLLTLQGHTRSVGVAAFSPDGVRILTASSDKTARVWDAGTGRSLLTLHGHAKSVEAAAFSPDGSRILTANAKDPERVWDAATGRSLLTLERHTDPVSAAAFSPDGARILTASSDDTARVWEASTGRSLLTLEGHTNSVKAAAFSPDGARILTASWDDTARVWEASTGRSLLTLQGHTNSVVAAAFSPDGTRILTASWDGTARVWEASTGRSLLTLQGHTEAVVAASFSPDGTRILTASRDGTARGIDISTPALFARGCRILRRNAYTTEVPAADLQSLLHTCESYPDPKTP